MNLGMLGAIGGAGTGLTQAAQMSNANKMEQYKLQVEEDMRNRIEDRRTAMAGKAAQQARASNAADAQAVQQKYEQTQNQGTASTVNQASGSQLTPEDVAAMTPETKGMLNQAWNVPQPASRADELSQKADIALNIGNPELSKQYTAQQQIEINKDNAQTKADLNELKARVERGQKDTANQIDYRAWQESLKAKGISDPAKLGFDDYMRFIKQMDLGQYKAYTAAQRGIVLNPDAPKPVGMDDGSEQAAPVDYRTYFKK